MTASLALPQSLRFVASDGKTTAAGALTVNLASASGPTLDLQIKGRSLALRQPHSQRVRHVQQSSDTYRHNGSRHRAESRLDIGGSIAGKPSEFDGQLHVVGDFSALSIGGLTAAGSDINFDAAIAMADDHVSVRLVDNGVAVIRQLSGAVLAGKVKEVAIPLVQSGQPLIVIDRK